MKAFRPESLETLKALLMAIPEHSAFIAGGTDWIIKKRIMEKSPECLVSLSQIPEMKLVEKRDDGLFIGATCTMTYLERHPLFSGELRVIAEAAARVGSVQIRNRGTIGGNIVNASPAADLSAPLLCLEADVIVLQKDRIYKVQIGKFIVDKEKTILRQNEIVLGFCLPRRDYSMVSHYYKLGFRQEVSIARFGIAMALQMEESVIKEAKIAVSAIGPTPVRMPEIERLLRGRYVTKQTAHEAGTILRDYILNTSGRKYKAWASLGVMEDALERFSPIT